MVLTQYRAKPSRLHVTIMQECVCFNNISFDSIFPIVAKSRVVECSSDLSMEFRLDFWFHANLCYGPCNCGGGNIYEVRLDTNNFQH